MGGISIRMHFHPVGDPSQVYGCVLEESIYFYIIKNLLINCFPNLESHTNGTFDSERQIGK